MGGRTSPMVGLVATSIGAGLAEAAVLVLVANVAAAMVLHGQHLSGGLGPLGLHLTVGHALLAALALALLRLVLAMVVSWLPARMSAEVQAGLRRDLFDAYTRASWATQANDRDGHLQALMTDQINQATSAVISVASAISAAAMFLSLLVSALALNPVVAMVVLASSVVLFGALQPLNRRGRAAARELSQANMDHAGGVSESVRLAEEAQVFGAAPAFRRREEDLIQVTRGVFFRFQLISRLGSSVYQSLVILFIVGGLGGLYLVGGGALASLGAVVLMLVRASAYGQQFQGAYLTFIQMLPYLERLESAVSRYHAAAPPDGGRPLPAIRTLSFDQVTFSYVQGTSVLCNIGFQVEAGETVGIIGPTGAGKSTVSQLLLRLREPDTGDYLINGKPASTFARAAWQSRVAYVPQEPQLLQATVADNIRFFRDIDDDAVRRSARLAHVHKEIMAMPEGYGTMIGQRADAVSGGQRQRICLARALAGRPDMLLLDEPTSALDLASEMAVQASLARLHGRVTLFIVAHRMTLLEICDRVLVLDKGRVIAFAPATDLAGSNAFYRKVSALSVRRP